MPNCYLPHHSIEKTDLLTTKTRIDTLLFFWWFNENVKTNFNSYCTKGFAKNSYELIDWINHFKLNSITYETSPASFLATRLKQFSLNVAKKFPTQSKIISSDSYLDDLLTGNNMPDELIKIRNKFSTYLFWIWFWVSKVSIKKCYRIGWFGLLWRWWFGLYY